MSELSILHQEPRHKVSEIAHEILGRRSATIYDMRVTLTALLAGLCEQFDSLRNDAPLLKLDHVVIAQTVWTRDGQLCLRFGYQQGEEHVDVGPRYHVDDLIHEMIAKEARLAPLADELAQFISALVDQFGALKKTHMIDLTAVTFERMRWLSGDLLFDIRLHGKPFAPREARWV